MLVLWVKALHLIAMVAWFAGVFYMFRLLVYQAENKEQKNGNSRLGVAQLPHSHGANNNGDREHRSAGKRRRDSEDANGDADNR